MTRPDRNIWMLANVCLLGLLLGVVPAAAQERRLALVIGVSDYSALGSLDNAQVDAERIAKVLGEQAKFTVTQESDPTAETLALSVALFVSKIREGDVVMVYYAGHGVQINGQNYLLPSDFPNDLSQLDRKGLSLTRLLREISARKPALKIVVIDACRNNPLKGAPPGLARMPSSNDLNTYIEFAAGDGKVATDDGLFARHLSVELARPGLGVEAVFRNVRADVDAETNHAQTPVSFSQLSGQANFFFISPAASGTDPLALLERTAASMPQGDMGQTAAVENLIRNRFSFAGTRLLRGISLRSGDFSGGDFNGASFTATDLSRSNLSRANLSAASLLLATLRASRWRDARLTGATLAFADLDCESADAESCADLTGAKATDSRWFGASARGADFTGADLSGADLAYTDLRHAKFDRANLTSASFIGSDLRGATFTGATLANTDFGFAKLDDPATLKGACATTMPGWNGVFNLTYERVEGRNDAAMFFVSDKWAPSLPECSPLPVRDDDRWGSRWQSPGGMSLKTDYSLLFDDALKKRPGLRTLVLERANALCPAPIPLPEGTYRALPRTSKRPPPGRDLPTIPPSPDTILRLSADTIEILQQGKTVWRGRFQRQAFEARSAPNTMRVTEEGKSSLCDNRAPGQWTQEYYWLSPIRFFFSEEFGYGIRLVAPCPQRDAVFAAEFELVRDR